MQKARFLNLKLATGGTISIGVKYIPDEVQELIFGAATSSHTVETDISITGLKFSAKDIADYVGVAFYAPDKIDGQTKYTCVIGRKTLFGPPSMNFQTKGENITFNTPTTTGEFLADDSPSQILLETGVADTEAAAIAWVYEVLQ